MTGPLLRPDVVTAALEQDLAAVHKSIAACDVLGLLARMLDARDGHALAAMASESYQHANGFAKLSLPADPATAARVRLHIWRPGTISAEDTDAHNHRWDFTSRVLAGQLHQGLYDHRPDPDGEHLHFQHEQTTPDRGYSFRLLGRSTVTSRSEQCFPAGSTYQLAREAVHRVWPEPGRYTATLVIEHPPSTTVTDVLSRYEHKVVGAVIDPSRFPVARVRHLLAELAAGMQHG